MTKAPIFGIDIWAGPSHEEETCRLTGFQKRNQIALRMRRACKIKLPFFRLVPYPGNIAGDGIEAGSLQLLQPRPPQLRPDTKILKFAGAQKPGLTIEQKYAVASA